ncbi:MAG: hypothetical protein Q8M15_13465 [Bacteroidota bacterium]|nr:hypothetical protein [Bacteroidota bacterium]
MNTKLLFIFTILFVTSLNQNVFGQDKSKKERGWFFPQPKGFVYIPSEQNVENSYSFYCLEEPVKTKDFKIFIKTLVDKGDTQLKTICNNSLTKPIENMGKYVIINNPIVITAYVNYMRGILEKENPDFIFNIRPITAKEWKRIQVQDEPNVKNVKSEYGVYFIPELGEFYLSQLPNPNEKESYNFLYPKNNSGGFRLVMSVIGKK